MKRTKFTALLALVLALLLIAGCGKNNVSPEPDDNTGGETAIPTDIIEETEAPSEEEVEPPVATEGTPGNGENKRPETQIFTISIEGTDEEVEMSLYYGDFTDAGGPKFSIYADDSRYELIEDDGRFRFVLPDMKEDVFLDIAFVSGKTAKELAPGLLDSFEPIKSLNDEGLVELGENIARHVYGQGEEHFWEAYVIDVGTGCVTLVLSAPSGYTEGHMARLFYMAETILFS
ncbi:MAG TPA: hypothetical protein GXZ52_05800 [Clostridiales bacterium]|nr:hypothetical protein [Clostridiales bacterium]